MIAASCAVTATLRGVRRPLLLLLFAAVVLASCAGGDDSQDVEGLLDKGFSSGIRSADLKIEAELELKGSSSFGRPVRLEASGPFISGEGRLPSTDIELKVGSEGNGQTVSTGVLTVGDRAFLKFQDVYYEQPRAAVRRANRALEQSSDRESSFSELGFTPRSWLSGAQDEGEAEVAGVETRHVSGSLDVRRLLADFNGFVRRSGTAVRGATGQTPPTPLTSTQVATISEAVENPSFDVYLGKKDGIIRRVSGRIEFEVPKPSRAGLGGIDSGSIKFSVEFADVNGDQEVEAPANARPLSALTRSLGGGSVVEGLTGVAGAQEEGASGDPAPVPPAGNGTDQGGGVPGASDGTSPAAEDFEEYADCLDEARPEDTEALQRCADLLQP